MSLLAGFDFLTEISNETLRKVIQNNLKIGGASMAPPSELFLPISAQGVSGTAHLIFTDFQLDLNADDTITLTLGFNRASVVTTNPLALTVCGLDGNITITAALQLVNKGGSTKQISINLGAATVAINWSAAANTKITNALNGTMINISVFKAIAVQGVINFVHSVPAPSLPFGFSVVPGVNGSLTPSLQFEKLEVHCIPNANRNKQALGIFGILLVANHNNGNHNQKTATAITAANNGICISISPAAFHTLVFCPAIASSLGTTVANLPNTCGPAGGFVTQGVTIGKIADTFANGQININGSASKSGTCYDASGTFHGNLTFTISGSTLTPHVNMDQPDIDVSIPWYCWLAAAFVLGPIGIALAAVVSTVGDTIASSMAGDALKNALGNGIPGIGVGGLAGASFSAANVTTEGLTLQGTVPLSVFSPFVMPQLFLNGSVITTNSQTLSSGIFHTQIWCMPEAKDYPYTEYSQDQVGNYSLSGVLVSQPLVPHYSIYYGGNSYPLVGKSGTIELPNMNVHYPMPLATGGTAMQMTVHVGYSITGTSIKLTNVPTEGDYSFSLNVTCTDCNGAPVKDDVNNVLSTFVSVQFEGDHVSIGGGYASDVQYCAYLLQKMIKEISDKYKIYQKVPIWQQVNYPPPERVIEYIRDLVASEIPQADEVLVASKIAHGNTFYRALFSPAANQPQLLTEKSGQAVNQQKLSTFNSELANFKDHIANLENQVEGCC